MSAEAQAVQVDRDRDLYLDLLSAAGFRPARLRHPSAWLGHIPFAAWLVGRTRPQILVELGAHHGHSYLAMCQAVREKATQTRCFAVDTWKGDPHADHYGDHVYQELRAYHDPLYASFSSLLRMTFDQALDSFGSQSIDLLHIDGSHDYQTVKHDFESWLPKVAPGGVILLHDTNVRKPPFGVWRLWEEVRSAFPLNLEFTHDAGLGALQTPGRGAVPPQAWLDQDRHDPLPIRRYFAALGALVVEQHHREKAEQRAWEAERRCRESDGLQQRLSELEGLLDEERRRNHDLTAERDAARARVADLEQSLSWTATRPLRAGLRMSKTLLRAVADTHGRVRHGGGYRGLIRAAATSARDQGLAALWRVPAAYGRPDATGPACATPVPVPDDLLSHQPEAVHGREGPDPDDYAEWIRRHDTVTAAEAADLLRRVEGLGGPPLFSVILPVYAPRLDLLDQAVWSVRNQVYPHWELCIADDASPDEAVRELIRRHAVEEPRIKFVFREANGHISAASNSALELAGGEFIALLDHDDLLPAHALACMALAARENPRAGIIYSDEDKIDEQGRRSSPYFKSDFNPELFLSQNMISHLGCYRLDLVRQVGGFRKGLEGSQDYDLALRCLERLLPDQVVHVPRVLYHWRTSEGSTSVDGMEKPYALLAGQRAIGEHLQRRGVEARVELLDCNWYRVHYTLPDPAPRVSLIIPTRNRVDLLRTCLESILTRTAYPDYEVLVVDNATTDVATLAYFDELRQRSHERAPLRIIRDERPFNFSALNNVAADLAEGPLLALVNNDVEVIAPGWLEEMASLAVLPGAGAVGARLWYPNDTLQHAGVILGLHGLAGHAHKHLSRGSIGYFGRAGLIQNFSAVSAACMVIRKETYLAVGGFNEHDLPVCFNDVDFCLRLVQAGLRNVWTPYAELCHHETASRGRDETGDKGRRLAGEAAYMHKRWAEVIRNDPCYNPNLTLDGDAFGLAWPPRGKTPQ